MKNAVSACGAEGNLLTQHSGTAFFESDSEQSVDQAISCPR